MNAPKWTDLIGIDPTYGMSEGDQHDADIARLTVERDRARAVAVDLEQENAMLRDLWARSEVNLTRTVVGK